MNGHEGAARLLAVTVGAVGVLSLLTAPAATADDGAVLPMAGVFRRCDFTANTYVPTRAPGQARARIGSAQQQKVTADVELYTAQPYTRYTARLIQMPRPSLTCSPTDPGVFAASMDTDAAGAATFTIAAPLLAGTTGVWVVVDRPGEGSQTPDEFYTSDYVARV